MFNSNSLLIISFFIISITSCSTPENKDSATIEQNERSVEKKENTIEQTDSTRKEKCLIHSHKIILPNGSIISPLIEVINRNDFGPISYHKLLIESNSELEYISIVGTGELKIIVDSSINQPFLTRSVGVEIMDQKEITITVPSTESLTKFYINLGTTREEE
jgi:hypothetical protein